MTNAENTVMLKGLVILACGMSEAALVEKMSNDVNDYQARLLAGQPSYVLHKTFMDISMTAMMISFKASGKSSEELIKDIDHADRLFDLITPCKQ